MIGWGEGRRPKPQSMEQRLRQELGWPWWITVLVIVVIWILVRR